MPPERRVFASPPRSPEMAPIALLSPPTLTSTSIASEAALSIPSIHIPDACASRQHAKESSKVQQHQQRRAAAKRQSSQSHEAQPRHQHLTRKQHRRLQDAHEEYHRQREVFQAQQQRQQQEQQQKHQYHYHPDQGSIDQAQYQEQQQQYMYAPQAQSASSSSSAGQYSPSAYDAAPAPPLAPSQRFSIKSNLSRSSSSSSLYQLSSLNLTESTEPTTTIPRSRRSSPGIPDLHHHPPRRRSPYSAWTAIREKEHTRLLTNLSNLRESLQTVPLPSQVARENLSRLHQRIQRRRARARETILYDLHQGVKVVEAQVHRQVEMVLSRLKGAPASKYAFALTNSFLSQIPHTVTGSLLAQAANGFFQTESSTFAQQQQQQQQHQDQQETNTSKSETDALSNEFDSIALAGQLGSDRPSALAGLSNKAPPGVAAACSQILSAALPSFIPSMVAPLVCVFSYQTPSISALAPIPYTPFPWPDASSSSSSSSSSDNKKVEEPARKEFVYPWGHPNDIILQPHPPTTQTQSPSSTPTSPTTHLSNGISRKQQPSTHFTGVPDSGVVVIHSKTWTRHEREALYLAATRFRLSGQWSKIREMMNLHRTDEEIETEYKRLYAHRDNDVDDVDDEDEDYHYDAATSITDAMNQSQFSNSNANSDNDNDADVDDIDEETEKMIFMRFGGGLRSTQQKRQQLQHQQSTRLHYDQLHFQQPIPQQELQHHHQHYHQQQQQLQQSQGNNINAYDAPPLHDSHYQQQHQQQQSLSTEPDPIRIFKKEVMIDKRFTLEEIPMRI
ncbi:hypothetical protein BGZ95_003540 [Linnemannia exigua]|uniref:Myb-like domain-containing protein n=1 Tax=Linnemannia exigua TaxID=604196 RepID=A0AAD4H895_9FUNG|nr:hypothetical protein BGZ95_003540 [Linnemannia exigua]